ncbi:MAG TPA: phage holin family protein [Thermoleophilaceae bacterium]|nr:phage holin family protein [Thermoleophilaceae bacterium]
MSRIRVLRAAVVLLVDALALLALSELLPGFTLDGFGAAFVAAAAVGILNALVWPLLARFTLPLNVMTLGLATLVLNGVLMVFAIDLVPGADIEDVWTGVGLAIGLTLITTILASLLAIDEDDSWYRNVVRRQARRSGRHVESDVPGIVFLEIDGLAHDILRRAMRDGNAPTLARWLREGTHRCVRWETDWSSQTGACQAGLLHGNNHDMPAFRWWEKDRGKPIVTNHPRDAEEIERRHSDGRGLLHADGASRANILSGDAPHTMLTMSTVMRRRRPIGRDYSAYFANPYAVARTLVLSIGEYAAERRAAAQQRRRDVHPRIHRGRVYAVVRAWGTIVQRDLQVAAIVGDMMAGRPVVYTTFLAYDEVAHHSGVERPDTLVVLRHVDRQLARVQAAAGDAPRPYRLVVLADHGQSQGATFLQRYGMTLEDLVRSACDAEDVQAVSGGQDEAMAYLSAGLTEVARDDTVAARTVQRATRTRRADGVVALDEDSREEFQADVDDELPELSVMASGCLGLITFPREPGRVTLERLEALHPRLLPTLRDHRGIGFVHVRSEQHGALAIGRHGIHFLDDGRVEGDDPLAPFGPHAADHVRRTDSFPHCPDVVVNSSYWEDADEVAAFEELVGSHGGMGGGQSFPFVLFPAELEWPEELVVGAERVHRIFRGWLAGLGHDAYAETAVDSPGASTRTSTSGATAAT